MRKIVGSILCLLLVVPASAQTAANLLARAKKEQHPAERIRLLTKAIAKDPKLADAYHYRADAYQLTGQTELALKDYNSTVELRPKDPFRYYARGLSFLQGQKYTQAQRDFSKAISLKPAQADFYLARARAYNGLEKYNDALTDYRTYRKKSSRPENLTRELIPVYLNAYRYDTAKEQVEKLAQQGDDSADVHYWYGRVLAGKNQPDEAISSYSTALNRDAAYADAYRYRGDLFKEMKDYPAAVEDYSQLIELQPEALFYNKRGLTYEAMHQFEKAAADYTRAIDLSPRWAIPYNNRAFAKMNLKKWADAKADLEKAIALDPSAPTPYVNLAGVYWTWKKDSKNLYNNLAKAVKHNFKNFDSLYDTEQKGWLFKGVNQTAQFRGILYK